MFFCVTLHTVRDLNFYAMKSSREVEIATSRKRALAETSLALSDENVEDSDSDFEESMTKAKSNKKAKATNNASNKRSKTATPVPTASLKIPSAYVSDEGHDLFTTKWWKEISGRDEFWKDLKKKVPKSYLGKRLMVNIVDDLTGPAEVNAVLSKAVATNKGKNNKAAVVAESGTATGKNKGKAKPLPLADGRPVDLTINDQDYGEELRVEEDSVDAAEVTFMSVDAIFDEMIKTQPNLARRKKDVESAKAVILEQMKIEREFEVEKQTAKGAENDDDVERVSAKTKVAIEGNKEGSGVSEENGAIKVETTEATGKLDGEVKSTDQLGAAIGEAVEGVKDMEEKNPEGFVSIFGKGLKGGWEPKSF